MKPLRQRLEAVRKQRGIPWHILERDYALSWVLVGLAEVPRLREQLVFKGGTALKKCYFGDYRFSEDLDFSALPGAFIGSELEAALEALCSAAVIQARPFVPLELTCERYIEKEPHPEEQDAFVITARLPWHTSARFRTRVSIEITRVEKMLWPIEERSILHDYGEPVNQSVQAYALEEIVAEKLRAILQHQERFQARHWTRSRARDYYDLWRILSSPRMVIDPTGFIERLHEKCIARGVDFAGPQSFFEASMLSFVERTWTNWLGDLVFPLPPFVQVIEELRPRVFATLSPK